MNSINKAKVEDELKKLTAEYIKATHSEDKQLAKNIMQSMEELKKLAQNTKEFGEEHIQTHNSRSKARTQKDSH